MGCLSPMNEAADLVRVKGTVSTAKESLANLIMISMMGTAGPDWVTGLGMF